jgi:hypothetical protein
MVEQAAWQALGNDGTVSVITGPCGVTQGQHSFSNAAPGDTNEIHVAIVSRQAEAIVVAFMWAF